MKMTRFAWYDRLINLAFWGFLTGFAISTLAPRFLLTTAASMTHMAMVLYPFGYAIWILTVFLICARFMRDEYTEILWQRTAATFAYLLVLLPAFAVIAAYIYNGTADHAPVAATAADRAAIAAYPRPIQWQMSGAMNLLHYIAAYVPFLFLTLFKWHGWREER